jgi:pectate lyase
MKTLSSLALATAVSMATAADIPAFPGATGAGMHATGGRGGQVVRVTNLNRSGSGSLAGALSGGNRIIVFEVSGIIDLTEDKNGKLKGGRIDVRHPNVTIAGQTAPGEGICIKGGALHISADNVIVQHLRLRRGWITEADTGDCIEVKPESQGELKEAAGQSDEAFAKRVEKKELRGKIVHDFADLRNIIIDHCSTSWATDENLTVTHTDRTTISWSIAAEGCDYPNPKQTPPNHSEGSLWGSEAADGRATMHHVLFAHNRLRNPRTTGGGEPPAVLTFYNNVVYDWSEYASHTGSERVLLNWVNNYYKPGPSTPAEVRDHMFEFHGDPGARIFARGNVIDGFAEATANNKLAVFHGSKFRKVPEAEREAMKVDQPAGELPAVVETAETAYLQVLRQSGATLPARDAVDWRIVNAVQRGEGRVIEKETDLPEGERWPDYRSLPPPVDSDGDGLPDFWERQFTLNLHVAGNSRLIAGGGYANVEHYLHNTDPSGRNRPIVHVAAAVSRARLASGQAGEWIISRSGPVTEPLAISWDIGGDAQSGRDYAGLSGSATIPAGETSVRVKVVPLVTAEDDRTVTIRLKPEQPSYFVGCPSAALVVIRQ